MEEIPDPPARERSRTLLLCTAVVATGLAGVAVAAATGRLDTAVLFVGVPCVLAVGVGLVRGRGGWGTVFQVVTVVLLLASALLGEAAVCVLLAAPLVYGAAALAYAAVTASRPRNGAFALGPLLVVVLLEGVLPGTRIRPDQQALVERVVSERCAQFEAALERGVRVDPPNDRGILLTVFPYPTPTAAVGPGLDTGDRWSLALAGGSLDTRVTSTGASSVQFAVEGDSTKLRRWVTVHAGTLAWRQTTAGCRATMTVSYRRHLDPALWFGPVSAVFMDAGAGAFLAGLD